MIRLYKVLKIIPVFLLFFFFIISAKANQTGFVCSSFIDTGYVEITKVNCDIGAQICLDVSLGDLLTYSITDNGQAYSGGVSACDFDTSFAYTYFTLPGAGLTGPYVVDSWSVDGNIFSGLVANMSDLADSMNVWDPLGNWILDSPTSSIRGGITAINYGDMVVTQVSSSISVTINITTSLNPNGSLITLDTGFHELIFTEPVEGCLDTVIVLINCTACPEIYSGNTNLMAADCASNTAVCFDISINEITDYTISDNGFPYSGIIQECALDSSFSYDYSGIPGLGTSGPYQLQNWMVNGSVFIGVFANVAELVNAMNIWDPGGNWTLDATTFTINGGNGANVYSNIEVMQITSNISGTAFISATPSLTSIELQLATGNHELIFSNNQNMCLDTINLFIDCVVCPDYFGGMPISVQAQNCDSTAGVCLPVPYSEIGDYSFAINDVNYTGGFQSCGTDSSLIMLDTGFYNIVLTNSISGCQDSVEVTVSCIPDNCSSFLTDEARYLNLNDCNEMAALCVEIPFSTINEYSIYDNNILYENSIVICETDTFNASINLTSGIHQMVFINDISSCSDTIDVFVACISTEVLNLTISVNALDTICIDTSELMGSVISFENVCEMASGEFALVELDAENYCVNFTGIEQGSENACIVVCDDLGFCDTTFINITIEQIVNPLPNAVDDAGTTEMNTPFEIELLSNDEINGLIDSFYLKTLPANGTAILNNDGTMTYVPNVDYCNSNASDDFIYFLCNENGCDSAMVSITVNCEGIRVHNGFSPNNDGKNDSFVIKGIQDLPGNKLFVYNRWGLLVYQAEDYQNDWQGTWNGTDLASGTYFYLFDDGKGNRQSGYVQIHR
jgi:gliding motility-associated-like protein